MRRLDPGTTQVSARRSRPEPMRHWASPGLAAFWLRITAGIVLRDILHP